MKTHGYTKPTHFTFVNNLKYIRFRSLLFFLFLYGSLHAQSTITAWSFNSSNTSPNTGSGTASIYGNLNASFPNNGGGKCWQLTNFANQSTQSGTRGVGFNASTVGFTNIQVNFEQRASGPASRWTQLDYSIDGGTNWILAYWNNNGAILPKDSWVPFSVDFTNVAGVDNNVNFRVRIVSVFCPLAFDESTNSSPFSANSAYMITESSAVYSPSSSTNNNTYSATGSWRFDNVSVKGFSIPVINATALTSAMSAEYGTNSNVLPVTISATNLIAGISATPEYGFELSTSASSGFSTTPLTGLTNGSVIYVRTVSNKTVGTFNAIPCILLQSNWAVSKYKNTKSSGNEITQKALTVTADDVYKEMGLALVSGAGNSAFSSTGLISGETINSMSMDYGLAGGSTGIGAIVGAYANQVTPSLPIGTTFSASNYLITYVSGTIYVTGFSAGNIVVNRIGDGASVLGTITYPLNLQEFLPTGTPVQTLNQQFSNANLLTETGELNTSNGHLNSFDALVGIPGYNAVPGTSNVAVSQPKVINILGLSASVNGRVVFPANGSAVAFIDGHLTSLLPINTNSFYAAGTGINNSGGIWYYNGTNFIQLNGDFNATRTIESYNGNLYFSTDVSPGGIYQLGTGLPTTSGQVATLVIPTSSPRGFSISPDGNTTYVTDDSALNGNNGGGIQKWIKQTGTWTKVYTHAHRASGLTVDFSDSLARIYATTFLLSPGSDNNKMLKIIDTDENATALELSLAGSNYLYKGLDFAPAFPPALPQISQVDHPSCTQSTGKVHLSGLPAGQWRITGNPSGSKTGTGSTAIVENLVAGQSYSFKVTSYTGRSSNFTSAVAVNAQPEIPTVPTGSAIQKRCQGADLTDLSLNQTNVLWYANVNSTIPLNASTSLVHNTHYFAAQLHVNGCESTTRCDVHAKLVNNGEWKGENVGSWKQSSNWCGGVPAFGATVIVPAETIIHLDTMVELSELNIESTANLNLLASKKLSVTGDITLNGDLTLEDKATLVQHTNSGWLGNGNVHVRQAISGTGLTTPNGRYWFVGSPMSNSMSQDYHAETSSVLKYFNEPTGAWVEINNATTPIQVGRGYFVQTGSMDTVEFSGGQLNNGNYTFPCTRTGETNFYRGFNLVSNPYPSYVDFDAVTKTNILPTMWYRTADQAQTMVFDTYNSLTGIGTSVGGEVVTNFIPPMQSFWVKIPTGFTTGEIGFANNMRSHHSTGYEGLKNTGIDYPVFIRMNLLDEGKKDQLIVFMDYHMSALVDEFDCEKMTVTGYPQLYTSVGAAKLVIDALPFSKLRTIVPLTMNLPSSKIYQFQIAESSLENVTLTLEDKQENVLQDLSDNPCYSFYSNNGIINDRFVLHINALFGSTASISNITNDSNEESSLFEPHISQSGLSGEIHIQFMEPISSECYVRIYDMSGKLIHTAKLYESESVLHLTEGTGIYFCEIDNGHNVFRKRIVITN